MSKIHFQQNKEVIISVGLFVGLLMLLIINLTLLIPNLMRVYSPLKNQTGQSPIDTETVNQAIKVLNGK
jgi:hypothetical protein